VECYVCNGPVDRLRYSIFRDLASPGYPWETGPGHATCIRAYAGGDRAALAAACAAACAAGYHKAPGRWTPDPADPYGDARYWDCAHGCGHRQTHPGYGTGRRLAELAAPAQQTLFALAGSRG
jgi:hypothetical protein